jgi:hypothetical protein
MVTPALARTNGRSCIFWPRLIVLTAKLRDKQSIAARLGRHNATCH